MIAVAMVMLRWPQALANGVSRGLSVCSAVIIPTLYPFMISVFSLCLPLVIWFFNVYPM
jgi:uncharacterized membrane-anchored protein YitT (DUF2179 family)